MTQAIPQQMKIRPKSFTYRTSVQWLGSRSGILGSDAKPEMRVSSPPEFRGEEGVWTPEDLFVAAVNVCTMTTFAALASKLGLPVDSYSSTAEGTLEFVDGKFLFTKVVVRPTIIVSEREAIPHAERVIHDAHSSCLIANSIKAEVILEPQVGIVGFE